MNTKITLSLLLFLFIYSKISTAQPTTFDSGISEKEYVLQKNDVQHPCITSEQYSNIESRCNEHAKQLSIDNLKAAGKTSVLLNWPLKASVKLTDCSYYYISAHVDHDNATTTYKDYNCGNITYDGHKGTDIAIGPFPFTKMDSNSVEIIAAAAGTIIDKHDGEFDRNCVGTGTNLPANYVIIQHSDGSRALYWHMKSGKVTSKAIGQAVTAGETIGIVGSSGSSSGAHMHFEVWAGSTVSTLVDPFSGTCNLINATSWWNSQKPYTEPSIVKASVHITDIVIPPCPTTETTNESTTYAIPFQGPGLSPGYAKFYVFMRNTTSATTVDMSILNPDMTVFNSWSYTLVNTNNFSYAGFSKKLPTTAGKYYFKGTYNGISCMQAFDVTTSSTTAITNLDNKTNDVKIFPNPFDKYVTIKFEKYVIEGEMLLYNQYGQLVKRIKDFTGNEWRIDRDGLVAGIYFIQFNSSNSSSNKYKLFIAD